MVTGNGDTFLYLFLLSLVNRVLKTSYILPLCFNSASKYNIKNQLDRSLCKQFFFFFFFLLTFFFFNTELMFIIR